MRDTHNYELLHKRGPRPSEVVDPISITDPSGAVSNEQAFANLARGLYVPATHLGYGRDVYRGTLIEAIESVDPIGESNRHIDDILSTAADKPLPEADAVDTHPVKDDNLKAD